MKATLHSGHEPVLRCPKCQHEILLTESLAAPLVEQSRKQFQQQLAEKDAELVRRTNALRLEREELGRQREKIDEELARRLSEERVQVASSEARKAREATAAELRAKEAETTELRAVIAANDVKLAEAQQAQAEMLRRQRTLDEEKRELDLTVERRVASALVEVRAGAKQEADDDARMRVMEKDRIIDSLGRTIEEMKRKAEQRSEQAQGEALELDLESMLRSRFPTDQVEPVGKGELGADITQQVNAAVGRPAGVILWECKRTKTWHDGWLSKLREDQRRCGADIALIVSQALPKTVAHFDLVEGVWVAHPRCALPLAVALRQTLLEVHGTRLAQEGQQSKMEQVYDYLIGTKFRQRVEVVVEKFNDMRDDLDRERKFISRQWAKREMQIITVVESTVGMVGDLHAIAGKAMPEISSLEAPLIENAVQPAPGSS